MVKLQVGKSMQENYITISLVGLKFVDNENV